MPIDTTIPLSFANLLDRPRGCGSRTSRSGGGGGCGGAGAGAGVLGTEGNILLKNGCNLVGKSVIKGLSRLPWKVCCWWADNWSVSIKLQMCIGSLSSTCAVVDMQVDLHRMFLNIYKTYVSRFPMWTMGNLACTRFLGKATSLDARWHHRPSVAWHLVSNFTQIETWVPPQAWVF
jgi:hypothetical protein